MFFGVFDGHGGPYCAEHVARNLWPEISTKRGDRISFPAKSTHLGKNILARLRDRARNVSDEVGALQITCKLQTSNCKLEFTYLEGFDASNTRLF